MGNRCKWALFYRKMQKIFRYLYRYAGKLGIPFVEYDPKGAAIQDKFEKGEFQKA